MDPGYNLYNIEASFKQYLLAGNQKPVSVKNYLSDLRHYFGWSTVHNTGSGLKDGKSALASLFTIDALSGYRSYHVSNQAPYKTLNRRLSTLRKFCAFAIAKGWLTDNPARFIANIPGETDAASGAAASSMNTDRLLESFEHQSVASGIGEEFSSRISRDVREFLSFVKSP